MLEIRILGPLELVMDGRSRPLGGPKQRALLAALLLERGRVVPRDRLIDALWADAPPPSAANSVHIYVSQLRRLLGGDGAIATEQPGYVLRVPHAAIDAVDFVRLVASARTAVEDGAFAAAEAALDRALALWRGPALADVAEHAFARHKIAELDRLRIEAHAVRSDALLALGRTDDAVRELEELVEEHPHDEQLRSRLMLALYRAGRQVEALDAYRRFRRTLADELGLEPGAELRQLEGAILRQDAELGGVAARERPSARASSHARRRSLPAAPTALVGRTREVAEAAELLRTHRLLTLTGPGGSGKTRLALAVADGVDDVFPDGVFWVPLQAVSDPALVAGAIATASAADGDLIEHIGERRLLVVLDNFEQVIDAAPSVAELLSAAPNIAVLVTSRQALHIVGERPYEVEPLPESDAVRLFCERANDVVPGFAPSAVATEICRRLDGLPLAIELAAARLVLLDPEMLLERLAPTLPLLVSRRRDAPDRQRTLRRTIEWSHDLLSAPEQRVFRRLGVFASSFTVHAAETVCDAGLTDLESLVDQSLVRRVTGGRLTLLDTVREYALERLEEAGDAEEVRRRHAELFLGIARSADLNAGRAGARPRLEVANEEQSDIRAALAWALQRGHAEIGLELAVAMDGFWVAHDPREGMRWFGDLLALPSAADAPTNLRAHALRAFGGSTDIAGEDDAAQSLYQQSLELFEQLHDVHGMATLLLRLAVQQLRRGDVARSRELVETARGLQDWSGDAWGRSVMAGILGAAARDAGERDEAYGLLAESAELAAQAQAPWWEGGVLAEGAAVALDVGRLDDAEVRARQALAIAVEVADRPGRVLAVGLLARIAAERGELERAARLWTAVEAEEAGAPLGGWRVHRASCETRVHAVAADECERARMNGFRSLDDAVAYALGVG